MGCYGVLDFASEMAILFVPNLGNLSKIWMTVLTKEDYAAKYPGVEIRFVDELEAYLRDECGPGTNTTVYVNQGVNSDSKLETQIPDAHLLTGL